MSSKTLSTGTLSLRFMQNAQRRQQLQEVELKRAEVKDEGEWEVGQDVKDAWGIGNGTQHDDGVVHESSYLPFLFSLEHEDTATPKPLGRRLFDKKGQDVSATQHANKESDNPGQGDDTSSPSASPTKTEEPTTKGHRLKVHARPVAISSLSDRRTLKGLQEEDRQEQRPKRSDAAGFMKPAGVDEPTSRNAGSMSTEKVKPASSLIPDVIDGARKRPRELVDHGIEEKKKRKKKKPKC